MGSIPRACMNCWAEILFSWTHVLLVPRSWVRFPGHAWTVELRFCSLEHVLLVPRSWVRFPGNAWTVEQRFCSLEHMGWKLLYSQMFFAIVHFFAHFMGIKPIGLNSSKIMGSIPRECMNCCVSVSEKTLYLLRQATVAMFASTYYVIFGINTGWKWQDTHKIMIFIRQENLHSQVMSQDFYIVLALYKKIVPKQLYSVKLENSLSIMQEDNKKKYFFQLKS